MSRCNLRRGINLQPNSTILHKHKNLETLRQQDIGRVNETRGVSSFYRPRRREETPGKQYLRRCSPSASVFTSQVENLLGAIAYFFQGSLVPISVNAENTRYITSSPALTRKITTSLFIGKVAQMLSNLKHSTNFWEQR
jgi:hypothetical protein